MYCFAIAEASTGMCSGQLRGSEQLCVACFVMHEREGLADTRQREGEASRQEGERDKLQKPASEIG